MLLEIVGLRVVARDRPFVDPSSARCPVDSRTAARWRRVRRPESGPSGGKTMVATRFHKQHESKAPVLVPSQIGHGSVI
jgi:hypothetical protein